MKTDKNKIFLERPYFLEGFVILTLVYEFETYPRRILMLCEHPEYQGFNRFWLTIPVDYFEELLPYLGEIGEKSFEMLKKQLENDFEECSVVPYDEFGEYLVCAVLVFKAYVLSIDETFVDFEIEDITTPNEKELVDGKYRLISDIAMDIYMLAMKHGYEYGAMFDYLHAMLQLRTIYDTYGDDRASYIVKAFLGNIQYWRIEEIKPLREELKELAEIC